MSNFKYTPYVTVPGSPRLEPGMNVRALLREPEDWKSLVGWLDLKSGELAAPNPKWHLLRLFLLGGWFIFSSALMGRSAIQLQSPQSQLWLLFACVWVVFSRIEYKDWRQTQLDLKALQTLHKTDEA